MSERFSKQKIHIDEGLFQRIHQGDVDAFKELYERSYRTLYAFLLSLTQNSEDAKDLLQDTFIQIRERSQLYQVPGNPMAWMIKIAHNLFLMQCRKENRIRQVSYEEMENELGFEAISSVENRVVIEKMFEILDYEDRNIIIMHDVNGLKHKEIAKLLNKPLGTVLARYNRSIKKLQKEFGKR